ncbi:MAG: 6-phosphogluconolactonase [Pseudomonadota bacterium]
MSAQLNQEADRKLLADKLARYVAGELRLAVSEKGAASIAVAGGSTPREFLVRLGQIEIEWSKVTITLTDERCVPFKDERSNARLLSQTLLIGAASGARFIPLYSEDNNHSAIDKLNEHALPLDICVLGMGTDMHTASLFPDAKGLAVGLDENSEFPLVKIMPKGIEEDRISMTVAELKKAKQLHLLITGEEKLAALKRAKATVDVQKAPVKAVLESGNMHSIWYAS